MSDEWKDAPQWVQDLMAEPDVEKPVGEDALRREVVKLRFRVARLEADDRARTKRIFALEVHLGLEKS